jgi:hypothetical protein
MIVDYQVGDPREEILGNDRVGVDEEDEEEATRRAGADDQRAPVLPPSGPPRRVESTRLQGARER